MTKHWRAFVTTIGIGGIVGAIFLLSGCSSMPKIVRELAKDPSTAHLSVTTIYGTINVTRINANTNSVPHSINSDGSVKVGN